jgi:hypothetical protein
MPVESEGGLETMRLTQLFAAALEIPSLTLTLANDDATIASP